MSDGPIQWPSTRRKGYHSLILCGDLIRAVQVESEIAVARHWGVRCKVVWKWWRVLAVPRMTNGTRRLSIEYAAETLTPEVRAMAKEAMHSPEVRAKLSAIRAGRPPHPNTIAAVRAAARLPKPEEWKRGQSERSRRMWEHPEEHGLPPRHQWTEEEIALIGTDTDRAVAEILGLTKDAVFEQRRRLGIPRRPKRWTDAEIALLGTATDGEVACKLGKSETSVKNKRLQLDITPFLARWTQQEVALLGTASDPEVARRLGKNTAAVRKKRELLGLPPFVAPWTEEEISWLGVDTDRVIAAALGRSLEAVAIHRRRLGIPPYREE